ncbi:hydantoinase B/oxoprolinase family protein [Conexibacter sp. JD483]|uniref:hydantoinase B/oxoprolinase family protein n=1 Tax=unclassified Conexibacter TaxID=2627773 RepID=UPI0027198362|nr:MULTISPECIES: hydantoinase B/oxoprolinase family protein [unclassified Conexibacter]MDO8186531.1 hydantoinase B/oxoprolinase family protein [Conexibacter sp. CPCC 205706]MDO8200100.1 hydantoinase B/oxoprolinase family protein [Conexibacter sp. CPCC 205762]MDR9372554.1 hydantoinase B/oxoprolinase family protein [Conexibacter sp. JD483]
MSSTIAAPENATAVDPVGAAIVANRLDAIAEHMAETMLRTSRSRIFQIRDFVTGIFDGDGRWIATKDYIPVLAGSLPSAYRAVAERFGDDVHDGDVFLLNDPYHGNNHPPDMTVLKPVFADGELVFWTASKGHHADVGGGGVVGYNPYVTDAWEDALRIPPVRLVSRGVEQRDLWDVIALNVRVPDFVVGDLHCQIGAVTVGAEQLLAMLAKFGRARVRAGIDYHLEASRRHMAREVAALRDGVYRAERHLDSGGANVPGPIKVAVEARVAGEHVTFDFTGSDPQVAGYANSTLANTVASSMIGLFAIVDPDVPRNDGSLAQFDVIAEPGTIVHAVAPAATTLCTLLTCETIVEAIWLALADAAPRGTLAGWGRFGQFAEAGVDAHTGRPFAVISSFTLAGSGGLDGADGWDGLGSPVAMGGTQAPDPELHELVAPALIEQIELVPDSAGAGRWRGGFGALISYRLDQDDVTSLWYGGGTTEQTAPYGLRGGLPGSPNWGEVHHADGRVETVAPNTIRPLGAGDRMVSFMAGGGGYGAPAERDPEAVLDDVRAGLVSHAAAREVYRVAVDGAGGAAVLDAAATAALRGEPCPGQP